MLFKGVDPGVIRLHFEFDVMKVGEEYRQPDTIPARFRFTTDLRSSLASKQVKKVGKRRLI